ncbi:hypothetical protein KGG73_gp75 [Streptomyces phage Sentinel]|uniref:Uncharacterized protein n=1 Tax=Streptomyces phage Sentinel TaxID=2767584 RepID=A0A873WEH8_9CAUD|nr:hypothetical protein KGG73_gp75 [Streptomyces phage Sentinel]QPB09909.1 hypothetical protein CPT_Sentinel_075 [Streptomyces phage Sentinel]
MRWTPHVSVGAFTAGASSVKHPPGGVERPSSEPWRSAIPGRPSERQGGQFGPPNGGFGTPQGGPGPTNAREGGRQCRERRTASQPPSGPQGPGEGPQGPFRKDRSELAPSGGREPSVQNPSDLPGHCECAS